MRHSPANIEIRVAGSDGATLPPGGRGELLVQIHELHVIMNGYYKDPVATTEAVRGGWFTGDRGWMDEDGYLFFVDRIKDVIRRRGENISAAEIEQAVLAIPAVQEAAAAVGVPSDIEGGEDDVAVFVLPRTGATVAPEDVIHACEARLAKFMVPASSASSTASRAPKRNESGSSHYASRAPRPLRPRAGGSRLATTPGIRAHTTHSQA